MSDLLLELSKEPLAKNIASSIGVSLPHPLRRYRSPWKERILDGKKILVGGGNSSRIQEHIALTLFRAGAHVVLDEQIFFEYRNLYENIKSGFGGIISSDSEKFDGLIFDSSFIRKPVDLNLTYDFFHRNIRKLSSNGRIVIIGRYNEDLKNIDDNVIFYGLEGFIRSIAKEIGKKGSVANLILYMEGLENFIEGTLRFLLSELSVYVDGQIFRITNSSAINLTQSLKFYKSLEGKVILVTGAARGIGEKTVEILSNEGAMVIGLDHPLASDNLGKVCERINGYPILADLSDPSSYSEIVKIIKDKFGRLDGIVHNAGITRDKTIANMTHEQWDQVIQVNLLSIIDLTNLLLESVIQNNSHIVCLSSVSGIAGNFGQTNYATSKAALIGWIKSMAEILSEKGIHINAVAPGFIETRMTSAMPLFIREAGRRLNNLSQGGQPEDVAQLIGFLVSPFSRGISGQVIRVCGGALIGA